MTLLRCLVGCVLAVPLWAADLPAGVVERELAGVALADYPWFEPIRSVDSATKLYVAVDPSQVPAIAGATCDVYVTPDRDRDGWGRDDTLADTTPGGPATVTFPGGALASNRFLFAAAGEIDPGPGSAWGNPLDVVLDCNRNGRLDAGDLLDGAGGAGIFGVGDTSAPGPLVTTSSVYGSGSYQQVGYYPVDHASLAPLPLVMVSHGWTHNYLWYDHIGRHLASYGYIVVSHVNDVGNGDGAATETAAVATLANIDYVLSDPGLGAAFTTSIDRSRIVLIGHSTGGEGIVRAYARLRSGESRPQHFGADDVVLLAPLAPVAFLAAANPLDVPFHIFAGAADTDTSNAPFGAYVQLLSLYERATGPKQLTYVHGVGHADLHNGTQASEAWADGPDLLGRAQTHPILLGQLLPVIDLYARGNPAGLDFVQRRDARFRPAGANGDATIVREYREAVGSPDFVIDDFQTHAEADVSSSGAPVTASVSNLVEVLMRDIDGSLEWTGNQPENGMTRARFGSQRCVVFDWTAGSSAFIEWEIVPAQRDFTDDGFLTFRAAQGTRHPETVALGGTLGFTVTLRDGDGAESSIDVATFGGIGAPYARTGLGSGAGWSNEFSTVRLRLTDFAADGRELDLQNIVALRFDFGPPLGSARGRLALDDLGLAGGSAPAPFQLTLARAGATATLGWPADPRAVAFNVYRGTLPAEGLAARAPDPYDHVCFDAADAAGDGPFAALDEGPFAPGNPGYYYLVTAVLPAGEGFPGEDSAGVPRPLPAPCP